MENLLDLDLTILQWRLLATSYVEKVKDSQWEG